MSNFSLRLRIFMLRFLPRTPLKRLAYAGALVFALLVGVAYGFANGALAIVLVVLIRWADMRLRSARKPRLSDTTDRYFFEGEWR